MVQLRVVFNEETEHYECRVVEEKEEPDEYALYIVTPGGHSIYLSNYPEEDTDKDTLDSYAEFIRELDFESKVGRIKLGRFEHFPVWAQPTTIKEKFLYRHPIHRRWFRACSKDVLIVLGCIEQDIVKLACEYDFDYRLEAMLMQLVGKRERDPDEEDGEIPDPKKRKEM